MALKKLDCGLDGPADCGIWANVSIVLSDSDGRSVMVRPRASRSSSPEPLLYIVEVSSSSSPVSCLPISLIPVCVTPDRRYVPFSDDVGLGMAGFLNTLSSDGLRSLEASRPVSACSLSRDGEGLIDRDAVDVGKGSLETGRGIPLGFVGVLGCLSIFAHYLDSHVNAEEPEGVGLLVSFGTGIG